MSSIKRNFIYSSVLTTSNYIFPLLIFPYISRILGVNTIGLCNFVDGIINYFILFSMLGITTVGIREIAKNKNDFLKTRKTFSSLLMLNTISTTIAFVILVICILTIPKLYENKELMFIGSLKLIFNYLMIEWFYTGMERFKFITTRTILVKLVYVISIFVFVKTQNDYIIYFLLTTLLIVVNSMLNCLFARKYFYYSREIFNVKVFFKPFVILGIYMLLTSMYISFNVIYLGFKFGDKEVGYYTTATKLYTILLALFTAFTGVMLPRMSILLKERKFDEFRALIVKSQDALFGFSIPVCIFAMVFAPQIIMLIAGNGYEGAVMPMRIIMPLILIIGYEQILVIQILMPLQKDRAIFINSIFGAITGIVLNIILVPLLKSVGSSIVWLSSELVVFFSSQYFVYKYLKIEFPIQKFLNNIFYALPALFICILIQTFFKGYIFLELVFSMVIILLYFAFIQIKFLKNKLILDFINKYVNTFNVKF